MLSEDQVLEIREHLERAQNPVFFFDNDCDGLMSFIILRKFIGRGKGVAVKSSFEESYASRIDEFDSDYVFILDRPNVSKEFLEIVVSKNLPVVWIDHHDVDKMKLVISDEGLVDLAEVGKDLVFYYNSGKNAEPVSYLTYKIANNKNFDWVSMIGCIADNYIPDFSKEFKNKYPELWKKDAETAFDVLYCEEFGKIIQMLDFALKDRTSNVVMMMNFLVKANSPFDILKENSQNETIHKRYTQINAIYSKILAKAKNVARYSDNLVFFKYGGDMSLSANLSNEMSYCFPGKVIIIAYVKGESANVSVRGKIDIRSIALGALEQIPGARGGGHRNAVGAKMLANDLEKFKNYFAERV
ncbi:MAG: hypothetical protein U9Q06_00105 [Nanoarchaeota archaeon]|nr:hypothetical protein [Nanoarchaeota archaeon]